MPGQDNQAWRDFVEVQKRRQGLQSETPSPPKEPQAPTTPRGFKAKWENYWYHYKAATIICSVFAIILIVGIWSLVTRTNYDMTVICATKSVYITEEDREILTKQLETVVPDVTGNGKVEVCIVNICGAGSDATASQRLVTSLQAGEAAVLLTDDELYQNYFEGKEGLVDLNAAFDRTAEDAYRISLSEIGLLKNANREDALTLLSVSVRDLSEYTNRPVNQGKSAYETALKLIQDLLLTHGGV